MIVAIDGPAGAGKSTVARAVAAALGAGYLDTGAMYRALTWLALERKVDLDAAEPLARLAQENPSRLRPGADGVLVEIDGTDVTEAIRTPEVTAEVSRVAAHPPVREAVVDVQREMIASGDWVADGRDIGTVVAPQAEVKIFLTATLDERARRRRRDLVRTGRDIDHDELVQDIRRRDAIDTEREASPLRAADDAFELDTSDMTEAEVVDAVIRLVARVCG